MAFNLHHRNLNKLLDFTAEEIRFLLDLSKNLKMAKYAGTEQQRLKGKNIALIFEKASTRTRCAFEVAAYDQGANVTYLGPSGSQIGVKESMRDTARVLGHMYDGIEYRGFEQATMEILAKYAGVPVWNGLTDQYHPTQILADFLTMTEHCNKSLSDLVFCFVGDAKNNMGASLMIGAAKLGLHIRIAAPKPCWPDEALVQQCRSIAKSSHGSITLTEDLTQAVFEVDFIYTDVWVSMGEPDSVWKERIELLSPYQVSMSVLTSAANEQVKFMHCLPAFHNRETDMGEKIFQQYGLESMEVSDAVFESEHSIVFQQAENRMHTIKAILLATLG
ncbi:MAG: ornithine carbamoyltransferase [Spongiibacteraceae bacterium]|nr:ornithine carbamoyltransferase [Spongiibacteraceae bacterium]